MLAACLFTDAYIILPENKMRGFSIIRASFKRWYEMVQLKAKPPYESTRTERVADVLNLPLGWLCGGNYCVIAKVGSQFD
jgi:hypothetical protein